MTLLAVPHGSAWARPAASCGQEEPRLFIAQEAVPLRAVIVQLARSAHLTVDLGGRAVEGAIEFSAARGVTISDAWRMVNEQLAQHGLALVRRPTQTMLTLVPLDEAAGLARLEPDGLSSAHDGFIRILYRANSLSPGSLASALSSLLPRGRTTVLALDDAGHIAVAGLRADVEQAVVALKVLDAAKIKPLSIEVPIRNRSVVTIGARLDQIVQKRSAVGRKPTGWFLPLPESGSIMIVAAQDEIEEWRRLVAQLDDPGDVVTRHYAPTRFGVSETAQYIKDVIDPRRDAITGWRLVEDALTGNVIITAQQSVHERIQSLLERLDRADGRAEKQLSSFEIRFRDAEEIVDLLDGVLDLQADLELGPEGPSGDGATEELPRPMQRTKLSGRGVRLTVDTATNRVLAFAEPRVLRQIERLLRQLDTPEPQVLIEATVVGLTDNELHSFGVELRSATAAGSALLGGGTFFGLGAPAVDSGDGAPPALAGGVGVILNPGDFSAVVSALETVGEGRSLSRPRVITRNHVTADLNSVLETPYAATVSTQVVATTTYGGSSEAGTTISVTPHLTSGGRVRLAYGITLSAFVGDAADPSLPPPRQQTVLTSEAIVPDGHTIVIGGLELSSESRTKQGVPWLSRVPLLGWLFKDTSRSQQNTRFFVFIRCDVLRAESFRALRDVTAADLDRAGLPGDFPSLEPRWMR